VILVDTCVLSEAFRKSSKVSKFSEQIAFFRQMILDDWPIAIPGIVFQEFLTGFDSDKKLRVARQTIEGFSIILADEEDHLLASRIRSQCLAKGVSAHGIDCLIASTAINRNYRLLTFDQDFAAIAKVCHLKMFHLGG
jgi:predicted nucleic acid-binding protein